MKFLVTLYITLFTFFALSTADFGMLGGKADLISKKFGKGGDNSKYVNEDKKEDLVELDDESDCEEEPVEYDIEEEDDCDFEEEEEEEVEDVIEEEEEEEEPKKSGKLNKSAMMGKLGNKLGNMKSGKLNKLKSMKQMLGEKKSGMNMGNKMGGIKKKLANKKASKMQMLKGLKQKLNKKKMNKSN